WHEFAGEGLEIETAAAPAAFVALLAAPLAGRGELVWVLRRDDLHAPGLTGLGFPAERLIQVCARDEAETLAVLEDALRTPGVAAAFGEVEAVDLTAGRRLQLACEQGLATGLVLRRRPFGGRREREVPGSAAATRWTIAPALSEPTPGEPGLGAPRWRVALDRCRGGRTGAWLMEALEDADAAHPFRVVAELGDRHLAAETPLRLAG
ncbi:MAG: ImuA family protein, partial [Caulobacterales bacterium]